MDADKIILSAEDSGFVTEGVEKGLSVKQIADEYELHMTKVKRLIEELGLADRLQNRSYISWPSEEDTQLLEEWTSEPRASLSEIAKLHKRTTGAITARVKQFRKEGKLPEEAKPMLTRKKPKKQKYHKWLEQDVETLERMVNEGSSWTDIALKIGRTYNSVYQKYQQLHSENGGTVDVIVACGDVSITVSLPCKGVVNISIPKFDWGISVDRSVE